MRRGTWVDRAGGSFGGNYRDSEQENLVRLVAYDGVVSPAPGTTGGFSRAPSPQRSMKNIDASCLEAGDTYMRLALRTQAQCRVHSFGVRTIERFYMSSTSNLYWSADLLGRGGLASGYHTNLAPTPDDMTLSWSTPMETSVW